MTRPIQLTVAGQLVRLCIPSGPATEGSSESPLAPSSMQETLPLGPQASAVGSGAATGTSPDDERARALVAQVGRTLLEVLQQRRPQGQLALWMADDAAAVLLAWRNQHEWQRCTLLGARACVVTPLVVEGSLHLRDARGDFCAAVRLEHGYGRWRVVVFDVLLPAAAVLARAS